MKERKENLKSALEIARQQVDSWINKDKLDQETLAMGAITMAGYNTEQRFAMLERVSDQDKLRGATIIKTFTKEQRLELVKDLNYILKAKAAAGIPGLTKDEVLNLLGDLLRIQEKEGNDPYILEVALFAPALTSQDRMDIFNEMKEGGLNARVNFAYRCQGSYLSREHRLALLDGAEKWRLMHFIKKGDYYGLTFSDREKLLKKSDPYLNSSDISEIIKKFEEREIKDFHGENITSPNGILGDKWWVVGDDVLTGLFIKAKNKEDAIKEYMSTSSNNKANICVDIEN